MSPGAYFPGQQYSHPFHTNSHPSAGMQEEAGSTSPVLQQQWEFGQLFPLNLLVSPMLSPHLSDCSDVGGHAGHWIRMLLSFFCFSARLIPPCRMVPPCSMAPPWYPVWYPPSMRQELTRSYPECFCTLHHQGCVLSFGTMVARACPMQPRGAHFSPRGGKQHLKENVQPVTASRARLRFTNV